MMGEYTLDSNASNRLRYLALFRNRRNRVVAFQNGLHEVARPLPHLPVDATHVFSQEADAEQGDADEEECDAEKREHAFRLGPDHYAADGEENHERQGQQGYRNSRKREQLQGHRGKPGDEVEVEPDETVKRIFRVAGDALRRNAVSCRALRTEPT